MLSALDASLSAPAASFALLAFPALLTWAAVSDVTRFIIPNWVSLALIVAFVPAFALSGLGWGALGGHLAMGVGFLVLGFALFATGVWGGGDGKLLAAVALWFEPALAMELLLAIALSGGALGLTAVLLSAYRVELWMAVPGLRGVAFDDMARKAPFGVAIAFGALVTLPAGGLVAALLG